MKAFHAHAAGRGNRLPLLAAALLALALCLLAGCGSKKEDTAITRLEQLNEPGRKIGVGIGTGEDIAVRAAFPDAEVELFNDGLMGYAAVADGKIDAFCFSKRNMELAIRNGRTGVRLLDETIGEGNRVAVGLSPHSHIPDLKAKIDAFIAEKQADGTLDDMYERWAVNFDETMPDIAVPEHADTRLRVGTIGVVTPFSYYAGTELKGFDIELARRFAAWLGAELEFKIYDYTGLIAAAQSGDVDCIMAELYVTPEREEAIPFSNPLFTVELGVMVRDTGAAAKTAAAAAAAPAAAGEVRWQDYNGRRLGVLVGPLMEDAAAEFFPDSEYFLFNSYPDCATALLAGRIDGFLGDEPGMISMHAENLAIDYIHESLTENNYAFAFRKDDPASAALRDELNEFLARARADGTMKELEDIWLGVDEARKVVDMSGLTGENGRIRVVTTSTDMPWSYIKDGKNVGYDIDLVVRFCRDRGYALELGDVDFAGRIPAVQSGKYDFSTDMNVTPERREQVIFSDPTSHGGIVLAVRASDLAAAQTGSAAKSGGFESMDELAEKRIGVMTGSIQDGQVAERFPDAERLYFSSMPDMLAALRANKIDSFACPEALVRHMMTEAPDLDYLKEWLGDGAQIGAVFPKTEAGQALCRQFNAFIREVQSSGVYEEIQSTWFGADESKRVVPDLTALPAPNGVLRMAADTSVAPFIYIKDGQPVGIDIDLVVRFCKECGYGLEVVPMDFSGVLASVTTGKADFACCGIAYTAERAESVLFSETYYESKTVMAVLKSAGAAQTGTGAPQTLADFAHAKIGVAMGTNFPEILAEYLPEAEILYFNTTADQINALKSGKIAAFMEDNPVAHNMMAEDDALAVFPEEIGHFDYAFGFTKNERGEALCEELSFYLRGLKADGTLDRLQSKWFNSTNLGALESTEYRALPATNGTVHVVTSEYPPFCLSVEGFYSGYDIEIMAMFCRDCGYAMEVHDYGFDGGLPAVQSGKGDVACSAVTITEERMETVYFSEPNYSGGAALVVLANDGAAQTAAADLRGATIGVQTGTTHDELVTAQFPDAKILYYNNYADLLVALSDGKIDAFPISELTLRPMLAEHPNLQTVEGVSLMTADMGFVAGKTPEGQALCDEFSAWFAEINASGEMDTILRKWTEAPDSERTVLDWTALPAERGTLHMATEGGFPPYEYYLDGKLVGIEVDLVARFCKARGYGLEITDMSFESVLPSVSAGKSDFAAAGIAITAVRGESLSFTEPYLTEKVVLVTLPKDAAAQDEGGFWSGVKDSFEKTFLRESRWKLFVQGIGTTLLITVASIALGTALGFGVYLLCRNGNVVANGATRFFVWLIHGMPMVVLLMILYYIIFGKVAISGTIVAVIGFTLVFGASVFGMLKSGVGAVEKGQMEAAYALGYTDRRAFFRVILPQALPHFFPAYKGEITATIKATAIVGYVAVQDLTKMGDIVRSRTYEAFFPLIAVAIIYFILAGILTAIVNRLGVFIDPRRRKKEDVLKGVTVE